MTEHRLFTKRDVRLSKILAEHHHRNQTYDIYPYIKHIEDVTEVLENAFNEAQFEQNIANDNFRKKLLICCNLHDCIEDGHLSYNDIKGEFGEEVAEVVYAVTDELGRNRKERKAKTYNKIHLNGLARIVKLCDRIANVSNSIRTKASLLEMYRKEAEEFELHVRNVNNPDVVAECKLESLLWEKYSKLFKE